MSGVRRTVYFNHGKESGPWGTKIQRLAEVARAKGYAVESVDYSGIYDADLRVRMLLDSGAAEVEHLILVGSSMGGYVATVASEALKPSGLFLMAPAFYLEGFVVRDPVPHAGLTTIVHGWGDDVVPLENSLRFARRHGATLHLIDDGHRLVGQLPFIERLFDLFVDRVGSRERERGVECQVLKYVDIKNRGLGGITSWLGMMTRGTSWHFPR